MKFSKNPKKQNGQVLVTALVIIGLVGLGLGAFLNMMTSNANFNARSQTWNQCIPIAEAGVEEAFAFLNQTTRTNIAPSAPDGWSWNTSSNAFYKNRTLSNCVYDVCISTNNGELKPTITSIGYVPAPVTVGYGLGLLAASGVSSGPRYISRVVQVTAVKQPSFPKGLVIKNKINFNGNNVTIDSYDAEVGPYDVVANCKDNGDVSTDADIDGGVSLGNADIKGHLWTGPNATLRWGPNSSVGSVAWVNAGKSGIQSGWLRKDSNLSLRDVPVPWSGSQPPPPPATNAYTLPAGSYEIKGNCLVDVADQMLVQGEVYLWVKGNLKITGNLKMDSPGDRLTVYVSGSIDLSGSCDKSVDPKDLIIYGLPTCKSVSIKTGSKMECVLYAPSADINLVGTAQLFGSIAGYSITMNGNTGFHYDESLGRRTGYLGYRPVSWREL
ncbi:MAG: hypothetical protein JWM16_2951 [Verrucomicrobiales bacterium]|nr:hypothetical protein [Verrucomicrobiales bacterium]